MVFGILSSATKNAKVIIKKNNKGKSLHTKENQEEKS